MNPVTGLSLGRIAIGVVAFARPQTAASMFGVDVSANPQSSYLTRLFGSREVAIGTAALLARGRTRRNLVLAGIAVDASDAVTGVLAVRENTLSSRTGAMVIGSGVAAVLGGLAGLRTKG